MWSLNILSMHNFVLIDSLVEEIEHFKLFTFGFLAFSFENWFVFIRSEFVIQIVFLQLKVALFCNNAPTLQCLLRVRVTKKAFDWLKLILFLGYAHAFDVNKSQLTETTF